MLQIVKRRYLFFGISLAVIIPGLIALLLWGFPLAIDFTGGSLLDIRYTAGQAPTADQVISVYHDLGFTDARVQTSSGQEQIIRSNQLNNEDANRIVQELQTRYGGSPVIQRFDTVGPEIGKEVAVRAAGTVGIAALGILLYITYAFRGIPHAFRYGVAAIIAMLHDVLVVIGVEAILGHFLHWEVDSLFLTALLTVIGFSVHDTIVVFDRIRENAQLNPRLPFDTVVNQSINQTLDRSINTQLTVMMTLLAMVIFGGATIRHFVGILLIGVFSGTYSSIFNASPILVVWQNREWKNWFHRRVEEPAA